MVQCTISRLRGPIALVDGIALGLSNALQDDLLGRLGGDATKVLGVFSTRTTSPRSDVVWMARALASEICIELSTTSSTTSFSMKIFISPDR